MDDPEVLQRLLVLLLLLLLRGWLALLPLLLLLPLPFLDISDHLPEGCPIYPVLLMQVIHQILECKALVDGVTRLPVEDAVPGLIHTGVQRSLRREPNGICGEQG